MKRLAVVVVAACGYHNGGGSLDAPPPDAPPPASYTITGHDVVRAVVNDSSHLPMIVEMPLHALTGSVRQPDGTAAPLAVAADDTFAFTSPTPAYRLTLVVDSGAPTEFQLAVPSLELVTRIIGRYDRADVPAGTALAVTVTGAPGGGTAVITSTGVWTQTARTSGSNASFTIDWTRASSLSRGVGLLDATRSDRAYYLVFDAAGAAPQYAAITAMCSADVTMAPGVATPFGCAATVAPFDKCAHVRVPVASELARIAAAVTPAYPGVSYQWFLLAPPAPELGPVGAPNLAYQSAAAAPPGDIDRNITYTNPFPGHGVALLMSVIRFRSYALPGALPMNLAALTQLWVPAAADCATPTTVAATVEIPTVPTLDGVVLDSDNLSLALDPSRDHVVTWRPAATGAADYWVVRVHQVSASPTNVTQLVTLHTYVVVERRVAIDASVLAPGSRYVVEIEPFVAFPAASAGDFRTVGYPSSPYALASVLSGVFEVTN